MSTVQEIESAIEQLPREEKFAIADWISAKLSNEWDSEIEEDIRAGRLDSLAQEAIGELREKQTFPFSPA